MLDRPGASKANFGERIDATENTPPNWANPDPGVGRPVNRLSQAKIRVRFPSSRRSVPFRIKGRHPGRRKGCLVGLTFTVGGARKTFEDRFADEVAGVLDHAFGAEGDWEGVSPLHFGEMVDQGWADLQNRAVAELGDWLVPNLLALGSGERGVFLPAHVRAVSLPLSAGAPLRCASLPGLRSELAELAHRWDLPLDDPGLEALLQVSQDPDDGWVAEAPEVLAFARLALAANEATRRDCPLWVVG